MAEMDFYTLVDELAEIGPVPEVPRTPVDLMNENATELSATELLEHLREESAAAFGCRLPFFEPRGDGKAGTLGKARDRFFLFLKGNAVFALLGGRNSDVRSIVVTPFLW